MHPSSLQANWETDLQSFTAGAMTLRERIGQTCQIHAGFMKGWERDRVAEYLGQNPVGGIFVGGEIIGPAEDHLSELRDFLNFIQSTVPVTLSVAGDLENGAGGAVRGLTAFPNMMALGAVDDVEMAYKYGRYTALEAVDVGFNWCLGPVADLSLNWLNPIVNIRSLGSDPALAARLLDALIRGMQDHGLSATAKHFPGDGVDFRDQHLCVAMNSLKREEWQAAFGKVFRQCTRSGVHAMMAGHIALPWADSRTNRAGVPVPATVSRPILTDLLRGEIGFEGVIVSDALIMAGFTSWAEREQRIIEAFNAGIDVMLWPGEDYFDLMERAIVRGDVSEERLNASVERVLTMKAAQRQSLLRNLPFPSSSPYSPALPQAFGRKLGESSLTLLRNRAGILPLDPSHVRKACVLVATARDEQTALAIVEPLLVRLRSRICHITVKVNGNCLDLQKCQAAGEKFDALIALFEQSTHGTKNTMRPTGHLGECMWMIQGLTGMSPIIVSLGSPYLLHDMPWAETYINAYGSSSFSLEALDAALFGEIPFKGACPVPPGGEWV